MKIELEPPPDEEDEARLEAWLLRLQAHIEQTNYERAAEAGWMPIDPELGL